MYDERLLNMDSLEIIITALGSFDFFVQRRFLSKTEYRVGVILPRALGESTPPIISM